MGNTTTGTEYWEALSDDVTEREIYELIADAQAESADVDAMAEAFEGEVVS